MYEPSLNYVIEVDSWFLLKIDLRNMVSIPIKGVHKSICHDKAGEN